MSKQHRRNQMSSKPTRQASPRKRAATSRRPAAQSSQEKSTPPSVNSAIGNRPDGDLSRADQILEPGTEEASAFLKKLTFDDWREMAAAQSGLSVRALLESGARTEVPIRVTVAGCSEPVKGVLLLDRRTLEKAIGDNFREQFGRSLRAEAVAQTGEWWLELLEETLGSWLGTHLKYFPYSISLHKPENLLGLLEGSSIEQINEWLSVPTVLDRLQDLGRVGTPEQRHRVRAILRTWTPAKRGRTKKKPDEHADVKIAAKVKEAAVRLKDGWKYVRANRLDGSRQMRETLLSMNYQGDEVSVLIDGHHRKLRGAAVALVARRSSHPIESISARASHGETLLRLRK